MLRKGLVAFFALVLLGGAAKADQVVIQNTHDSKPEIRVQVNMSFFVPGPVNASEASLKSQEDARKMLYANASRECDVLRETIASACRIESVSVNVNRNNYGGAQGEGFTATGNFGFRITLK